MSFHLLSFLKKYRTPIIEGLYLSLIFFISRLPMRDYDIWFHLKSGELFVKQGHLQFTEVFSHTAAGRLWIPYEWLFQVTVYLLDITIGRWVLPNFIGLFVVATHVLFLRILRKIFSVPLLISILMSFVFFASTYEFNTVRPHVVAYTFVVATMYIGLLRLLKGTRRLWVLLPITLAWSNLHSTAFLSWGLTLSFACIAAFTWFKEKNQKMLITARDLLIAAVICGVITILPPLRTLDYRLLWEFYTDRKFLGLFIAEWAPPTIADNPLGVTSYMGLFALSIVLLTMLLRRKKHILSHLWVAPFILIELTAFSAVRNVFLGIFSATILVGYAAGTLWQETKMLVRYALFVPIGIGIGIFFFLLLAGKQHQYATMRFYYPIQSTKFVAKYLRGNVFNDYSYGGYVLYRVYPRLQVFIDGRADVYRCCEMRNYMTLSTNKNLTDDEYKQFLDTFWDTYHISFAMIQVPKHNVFRKIGKVLRNDPQWALVFWDDESEVFVRRDGKNDAIIQALEAKAATPYLRDPFPKGKIEQALFEYERMDKIAQSAHTSNAIGYINLLEGNYEDARKRFLEAIDMDPTFESPYMNLGELAARDGNVDAAIDYYQKALFHTRDRGLIYIRLGQLVLQKIGDRTIVRKIWENGVNNTVDTDAREQLKSLLKTL